MFPYCFRPAGGRRNPAPLMALLLSLSACSSDVHGGIRQEVVPDRDLLLSSHTDVPIHEVRYAQGQPLPRDLAALATFDTAVAVGRPGDGSGDADPYVFGVIPDAEVDDDGDVLLLDPQYGVIRVFDRDLHPRGTLGRPGHGPNELVGPQTLLWTSPNELGVYDPQAARVERFARSGDTFRPMEPIPLRSPPWPDDARGADGRVYVRGVQPTWNGRMVTRDSLKTVVERSRTSRTGLQVAPDGFVHVLDEEGRVLRSFSMPYRRIDDSGIALQLTTQGGIACVHGRVWVAYGILGEVHALTPGGTLLWITRIADLDFPGYLWRWSASTGERLHPTGGLNLDLKAGNYSDEFIRRLTLLSPTVLAVDVLTESRGSPADGYPRSVRHRTYLLDAGTGELLGAFKASHEIIGGGHGLAVLYREDPFPRISVVRLGG